MANLRSDTEITPADQGYTANLAGAWRYLDVNGGYLATLALRAGAHTSDKPRPTTISCHYMNRARPGTVGIRTATLKRGALADLIQVEVFQEERQLFRALVWFTDTTEGLDHDIAQMPAVPSPGQLEPFDKLNPDPPLRFPIWDTFEERPVEARDLAFSPTPEPPIYQSWFRLRDGDIADDAVLTAGRALVFLDVALASAAKIPYPGIPPYLFASLHLTADFHMTSAGEWLFVDGCSPLAADGLVAGHGTVWAPNGGLVASATAHMICRPAQ